MRQRRYEGVSKSFRTESITKWTTTINTRWEATQRVMTAKLTRLIHKIAIQLHLVTETSTICSFRPRRSVRKLLDTSSYNSGFTLTLLYTRGRSPPPHWIRGWVGPRAGLDAKVKGKSMILLRIRGCNQKFPDWAAWSKKCKWYSSLPLDAVVSIFCESV
jgi:hypothetical protein